MRFFEVQKVVTKNKTKQNKKPTSIFHNFKVSEFVLIIKCLPEQNCNK